MDTDLPLSYFGNSKKASDIWDRLTTAKHYLRLHWRPRKGTVTLIGSKTYVINKWSFQEYKKNFREHGISILDDRNFSLTNQEYELEREGNRILKTISVANPMNKGSSLNKPVWVTLKLHCSKTFKGNICHFLIFKCTNQVRPTGLNISYVYLELYSDISNTGKLIKG